MSENKVSDKPKIKVSNIICYVCAAMFCAIPFVPFVDEMGMDIIVTEEGELDYASVVLSHLVLTYTWYAYFTIVIAGLIVVSTILRKNSIRLVTLVAVFAETIVLVIRANQLVMKVFKGDLYEPTVGYYMLLAAAVVVVIVLLTTMMKEKNQGVRDADDKANDMANDK